jgi:glycosyltransferase involved in cell wall biosynthesis
MITNAPEEYVRKYESRNIEFLKPNLSREELFRRFYLGSDIFLFLTHFDTFGFVMLEAMNFELPVIALREYATPEIVEDGKNGFLIDCEYVRDNFPQYSTIEERAGFLKTKPQEDVIRKLVEKCSFLIENEKTRKRMGEAGRRMVSEGRFSIRERNRKLKRIYAEALEGP